jgi:hypothetical protein
MSTTQTVRRVPPVRDFQTLPLTMQYWFLEIGYAQPLRVGDTTGGPYAEDLPQPGLDNSKTGQTNQNQELLFCKKAGGANAWTINGAAGGAVVITSDTFPNNIARFKSDGTAWYRVG